VDKITLHVMGGRGGNGCVSFDRGANRRTGPPDGGDGGRGGDIIIKAVDMDPNLSNLKHHHTAQAGHSGASNKRYLLFFPPFILSLLHANR